MIWQELILPSLKQAQARGQLKWVPEQRDGVIEHGHEGSSRYDGPRQFYIRFHSRSQLYAFFNNMKPIIKSIEDRNNQIMDPANKPAANKVARYFPGKKIKVSSSITNMHADLWSYLYTYDEVEHVKTIGNFLGVKIRGSNSYQKVTNPFGLSLAQMLEPMPTVTTVLARVCNPVPPLVSYSMAKKSAHYTAGRGSAPRPVISAAPIPDAAPVPVVAAPVPAVAASVPSVAAPVTFAAAPLPAVAAPVPIVAAPLPAVAASLPSVAAPVPSVAAPVPFVAAPLPTVAASAAAPLPTVAAPAPSVAAPVPAAAATLLVAAPVPSVAAPVPAAAATLLVAAPTTAQAAMPVCVPTGDSGVATPQP